MYGAIIQVGVDFHELLLFSRPFSFMHGIVVRVVPSYSMRTDIVGCGAPGGDVQWVDISLCSYPNSYSIIIELRSFIYYLEENTILQIIIELRTPRASVYLGDIYSKLLKFIPGLGLDCNYRALNGR